MNRSVVTIKQYASSPDSLREAIILCNGLEGLKRDDHIFIKPNLVGWDNLHLIALYRIYAATSHYTLKD